MVWFTGTGDLQVARTRDFILKFYPLPNEIFYAAFSAEMLALKTAFRKASLLMLPE